METFDKGSYLNGLFIPQEQARKLQATLVQNYHRLTDSLTGVKCRATSVAKKHQRDFSDTMTNLAVDFPCQYNWIAWVDRG